MDSWKYEFDHLTQDEFAAYEQYLEENDQPGPEDIRYSQRPLTHKKIGGLPKQTATSTETTKETSDV